MIDNKENETSCSILRYLSSKDKLQKEVLKEVLTLHRASPCGFYTSVIRKGFAKTPFMWSLVISE
jgi:hypothetical protein